MVLAQIAAAASRMAATAARASRAAKTSDAVYNARRREYRAAQRYLDKANSAAGATAEKNRAIARIHLQNALETYDLTQNQRISSNIVNLGADLGIDVYGYRQDLQSEFVGKRGVSEKYEARRKRISEESITSLESSLSDEDIRQNEEAKAIMNNPSLSKRIIGGLSSIWSDKVKKGASAAENREAITNAVFDYFGANRWSEVIAKVQQMAGDDLFKISNDLEMYDTVKIAIEQNIVRNETGK